MKALLTKAGHKFDSPRVLRAVLAIGGLISMIVAAGAGGKFN